MPNAIFTSPAPSIFADSFSSAGIPQHKVAHKEHIKGIEQQARYDECPDVIVAVRFITSCYHGNKARRENHGDVEVKGQTVS